jgi:hypothetical protein
MPGSARAQLSGRACTLTTPPKEAAVLPIWATARRQPYLCRSVDPLLASVTRQRRGGLHCGDEIVLYSATLGTGHRAHEGRAPLRAGDQVRKLVKAASQVHLPGESPGSGGQPG